jgi:hypothetical protein
MARHKMREALGQDPRDVEEAIGWATTINLTDPEVLDYLNKPLAPWEKTPRINTDDEQHYPEAWDDELVALQQAAAAEAIEPATAQPSLRERFKTLGKGLREKAHSWRRKLTVAAGVGATALALLTSSETPTEHDTTNAASRGIGVVDELPMPERSIIQKDVATNIVPAQETVTLGAWNPQTGEGSLVGVAEKKFRDSGQLASGEDVLQYASQIQTANQIDEPKHVQPGQKIILPPYQEPAPKG